MPSSRRSTLFVEGKPWGRDDRANERLQHIAEIYTIIPISEKSGVKIPLFWKRRRAMHTVREVFCRLREGILGVDISYSRRSFWFYAHDDLLTKRGGLGMSSIVKISSSPQDRQNLS